MVVIPKEHYENVYDIPDNILSEVYITAKKIAIAMKTTYQCEGTSMRQHNEPAGNQDVWHFHTHVFPRFKGDDLYLNNSKTRLVLTYQERKPYADMLREYFSRK